MRETSADPRRRSGAYARSKGSVLDRARAAARTASARVVAAPAESPAPAGPERVVARPAQRPSTTAAQRALARRAHRSGYRPESLDGDRAAGRASFVVLIIALLTVGVATTLWLSTQAVADSYRLDEAKRTAGELAEQAAELQREVTRAESASVLAERAKEMGMVPAGDPARLVVRPDGRVVVVGEPTPAAKPSTSAENPPERAGTTPGAG
ncbi:hypothetical protein BU204_31105 [Actinophytocola xanthii]|uniref:Cell division protein FtsL n=1 Tax=Actinophytocola xanthii TaxID=1912961 RepID=A0A1Q8C8Y7_9PSEU|nr:hypothetical protein BU204_31105 [Actinophytocola xanthii]